MKLVCIEQYLYFGILFMVFIVFSSFQDASDELKYKQMYTIPLENKETYIDGYKDTISSDSLYTLKTMEGIPLYYFRNISTEVCFDNQCRLLNIAVYWNITGRYLGFELPDREFLSKYDHEPFEPGEYSRLNELLADPTLPFGNISFDKLIELPETDTSSVDGASGATTENLAEIVVYGAAYTTYTLWNIVYGPTDELVAQLTEDQLSTELLELILKSPDISDRFWALDRIDQISILPPNLISMLLNLISKDNFSLTYHTINALTSTHLDSDSLQLGLFSKYEKVDHSIQKVIIDKLMQAPYLHKDVITASRVLLDRSNGKQLGDLLLLYSKHEVNDLDTYRAVSKVLLIENRYISRQAYNFLRAAEITDTEIIDLIDNYDLEE